MDKYEYKIKSDEIKQLIAQRDYAQAAEIADTIDWRRVKSVMMLCTISDLYKINRRYEDARDMLLLAYERRPGGRNICYSLCELSIKMEDFLQAVEYYKEFVQVAPKDSGRYVLQYKLYAAQDVSLEERIEVLEELKRHDYREKWAYELAYLYHRVGLATRCVEECDELILWFGEGKYVIKAMELKMLHQPLTVQQQEKYDNRFENNQIVNKPAVSEEKEQEYGAAEFYDTGDVYVEQVPEDTITYAQVQGEQAEPLPQAVGVDGDTRVFEPVQVNEQTANTALDEEMDIHVKTVDVGQYNTINLQAELAAGLREVLGENSITNAIVAPMLQEDTGVIPQPFVKEAEGKSGTQEDVESEVFFGETGELADLKEERVEILLSEEETKSDVASNETEKFEPAQDEMEKDAVNADRKEPVKEPEGKNTENDVTADIVMEQMRQEQTDWAKEQVLAAQPPKELASVLSQESDGQISLVMPERENLEKQITGQMSIEDILAEWERMKKENEEKRKEEVRQHVLEQTGTMFTEFEAAVRDGLLEQLESGAIAGEENDEDEVEELVELEEFEGGQSEETEPEEFEGELTVETELEETQFEELGDEYPEDDEPLDEEAANEKPQEVELSDEEAVDEEPQGEELSDEEAVDEETQGEESVGEEAAEQEPQGEVSVDEEHVEEETPAEQSVDEETKTENSVDVVPENQASASEEKTYESVNDKEEVSREPEKLRVLTREEKELYAPFIQSKSSREQLIKAIDNITLAAYTGNLIVTGEEGTNTLGLAKNIVREIQMMDGNFSGKVAKISGKTLNKKDVKTTITQLKNGALIIEKASEMSKDTAQKMHKCLQQESLGIVLILEDTKRAMNRFLGENEQLQDAFTARIDVEALSNDALVAFGRQYAKEREYTVDDLGVLALHTRIEDMQTSDHVVTVLEVKEIIDEAIRHANRKTLGHFFDVLLAKRYDQEDMIILTEKDFV